MNLADMCDKIDAFDRILEQNGYTRFPGQLGIKPWSLRNTNSNGACIDVRATDWTIYDANGVELATGDTTQSLDEYLNNRTVV